MSVELLYTSAPQGLKQGSRGFSTVLCTEGLPLNLATRLESLSGYRHVFPPNHPQASSNPVCYSHLKFVIGGKPTSILSRISDYGIDYSQRTNKLAHHVVLDPSEQPAAGPAWLLSQPGFMRTQWDGKCATLPQGPRVLQGDQPAGICHTWEQVLGDAGWGGVVAETLLSQSARPLFLLHSVEQSSYLLQLFVEAISLLPATERWRATFSTYVTSLPPDAKCKVRCVIEGTEEARAAAAKGRTINLAKSIPLAERSRLVVLARTGQIECQPLRGSDGVAAPPMEAPYVEDESENQIVATVAVLENAIVPPSVKPDAPVLNRSRDVKRRVGNQVEVNDAKKRKILTYALCGAVALILLILSTMSYMLLQNAPVQATMPPYDPTRTGETESVQVNESQKNESQSASVDQNSNAQAANEHVDIAQVSESQKNNTAKHNPGIAQIDSAKNTQTTTTVSTTDGRDPIEGTQAFSTPGATPISPDEILNATQNVESATQNGGSMSDPTPTTPFQADTTNWSVLQLNMEDLLEGNVSGSVSVELPFNNGESLWINTVKDRKSQWTNVPAQWNSGLASEQQDRNIKGGKLSEWSLNNSKLTFKLQLNVDSLSRIAAKIRATFAELETQIEKYERTLVSYSRTSPTSLNESGSQVKVESMGFPKINKKGFKMVDVTDIKDQPHIKTIREQYKARRTHLQKLISQEKGNKIAEEDVSRLDALEHEFDASIELGNKLWKLLSDIQNETYNDDDLICVHIKPKARNSRLPSKPQFKDSKPVELRCRLKLGN